MSYLLQPTIASQKIQQVPPPLECSPGLAKTRSPQLGQIQSPDIIASKLRSIQNELEPTKVGKTPHRPRCLAAKPPPTAEKPRREAQSDEKPQFSNSALSSHKAAGSHLAEPKRCSVPMLEFGLAGNGPYMES